MAAPTASRFEQSTMRLRARMKRPSGQSATHPTWHLRPIRLGRFPALLILLLRYRRFPLHCLRLPLSLQLRGLLNLLRPLDRVSSSNSLRVGSPTRSGATSIAFGMAVGGRPSSPTTGSLRLTCTATHQRRCRRRSVGLQRRPAGMPTPRAGISIAIGIASAGPTKLPTTASRATIHQRSMDDPNRELRRRWAGRGGGSRG